jgi:hypothetical protein
VSPDLRKMVMPSLKFYVFSHLRSSPDLFSRAYITYILTRDAPPTRWGIVILTQTIPREQCYHLTSSGFDSLELRNFSRDWFCLLPICSEGSLGSSATEECDRRKMECVPSEISVILWKVILDCMHICCASLSSPIDNTAFPSGKSN